MLKFKLFNLFFGIIVTILNLISMSYNSNIYEVYILNYIFLTFLIVEVIIICLIDIKNNKLNKNMQQNSIIKFNSLNFGRMSIILCKLSKKIY